MLEKTNKMPEKNTNVNSLKKLIPKNKFDDSAIAGLMGLHDEEIDAILPELSEWIADFNWPIAKKVNMVLLKHPQKIMPIIKNRLRGEETD